MADQKLNELPESRHTLTDDDITTERTARRRSFLTAAGAVLAGGAVAIALGGRADALAQGTDPDKVRDPDKVKDPDKVRDPDKVKNPDKVRDPDKVKHMRGDPDRGKHMRGDPDKKKPPPGDPDKYK